jgi:hypothetical protein
MRPVRPEQTICRLSSERDWAQKLRVLNRLHPNLTKSEFSTRTRKKKNQTLKHTNKPMYLSHATNIAAAPLTLSLFPLAHSPKSPVFFLSALLTFVTNLKNKVDHGHRQDDRHSLLLAATWFGTILYTPPHSLPVENLWVHPIWVLKGYDSFSCSSSFFPLLTLLALTHLLYSRENLMTKERHKRHFGKLLICGFNLNLYNSNSGDKTDNSKRSPTLINTYKTKSRVPSLDSFLNEMFPFFKEKGKNTKPKNK